MTSTLREQVAQAISTSIQGALNEWSDTGGNPWYARVSGANEPGDQSRILGRYAADAAIGVVLGVVADEIKAVPYWRSGVCGQLVEAHHRAVLAVVERLRG